MSNSKQHIADTDLIDRVGGTAVLARVCRVSMPSVSKWRREGIPPARRDFLELKFPNVFADVAGSEGQPIAAADAVELAKVAA